MTSTQALELELLAHVKVTGKVRNFKNLTQLYSNMLIYNVVPGVGKANKACVQLSILLQIFLSLIIQRMSYS